MRTEHRWALLGAAAIACGGPNFLVADGGSSSGATEGGTRPDGAAGDSASGHSSGSDAGGDSAAHDASGSGHADAVANCGAPSATNVYVKQGAATGGVGTMACPFADVATGVGAVYAASGVGTASVVNVLAGSYDVGGVTIPNAVTLSGASASTPPMIVGSGGGPCGNTGVTCALYVSRGATVTDLAVTSKDGNGIVGEAVIAKDNRLAPVIKNVSVSGAMLSGIFASGALTVGPSVQSTANTVDGMIINSGAIVTVIQTPGVPSNAFDGNAANGIELVGSAASTLVFGGGSASKNGVSGIRFASTNTTSPLNHVLTGLIADGNGTATAKGNGVIVTGANNVHVVTAPASTFNGNSLSGIAFGALSTGTLTFDGGTASMNQEYGIFLSGTGAATAAAAHTIIGLTAAGNTLFGINANQSGAAPMYLQLRASTLTGNEAGGLAYDYGSGTTAASLDIGGGYAANGTTPKGLNVFGESTSATPAATLGIRLCHPPILANQQPAAGDVFSKCQPSYTQLGSCTAAPTAYADVGSTNTGLFDPVTAPGCTTTP